MKNSILYLTAFLFISDLIFAQGNKVKISFDYGRSRSFLKSNDGNFESVNSTFQFGADYRLSKHWHLSLGLRHMITDYGTEFTQRIVHQTPIGGVTTVSSSLSYRNLGVPMSVGCEPLRNLVIYFSVIPTRHETASLSQYEGGTSENRFTIEGMEGNPRKFGVFLGSSIEYSLPISKRIEMRFGARMATSGGTLLKDESELTRLKDVGAFVGIGVKL